MSTNLDRISPVAAQLQKFAPRPLFLALLASLCLFLLPHASSAAQINLPAGFVETRIPGFVSPTAMAVAPDGRIFVCEHNGIVAVVKNGIRLSRAFVYVSVHQFAERGLVGIQLDPNFPQNGYVYLYYPAKTPTIHFRLSRFTANGDVALAGSEVPLFDLPTLGASDWHNGGGIQFAPDGKLYLAVGENNVPSLSQSMTSVMGKILRLNPDGTIPADNPFYNTATGDNRAIWALGLRNPFTIALQPGTGRLFINDVGSGAWEEINEGAPGANFGWPAKEGAAGDPRYRDPFHAYPHPPVAPKSSAITGGTFYNPSRGNFPATYVGKYFYVDGETQVFGLLDPNTRAATTFATIPLENNIATVLPMYLTVGPDGSLHYVARKAKAIHTIRYVGALAPQIGSHPASVTISIGETARFSIDAYGAAPLTYRWQRRTPPAVSFSDIPNATANTCQLPSAQLTDSASQFRCIVQNGSGSVTSSIATLTVDGTQPPVATIDLPLAGTYFRAGDTLEFSGSGNDPVEGPLPAANFTWSVDFQHLEHEHPFLPDTTGVTKASVLLPKAGETSDQIWYRIYLTVTNSAGLSHTTYRDVLPVKSSITLETVPPGLTVTLDERPLTAPVTRTTVVGLTRELGAADQIIAGIPYRFLSWSDSLAPVHTIDTPETPTTYIATFEPVFTEGDNAGFVSQTAPATLIQGQTNLVTVRMVNTGTTTWRAADNYLLASANPADTLTWGLNRITLPADVAQGQTATFTFEIVAPLTPGSYNFQWQMIREGNLPFGQTSSNLTIAVLPLGTRGNAAAFVSQDVPTLLALGATALATVTLRNIGTNTWTEATKHRLCSINPIDNGIWNIRRAYLGAPVPPAALYTFTFAIRAPSTPGTYNFQWMMVQETIERFEARTPNVVITVSANVPVAPLFTGQPASKTAGIGQTTTLTATATGTPAPTLQWQAQAPATVIFTNIPGANAAAYTTPSLSLADSGTQYRCYATNVAGNATSLPATVTVTATVTATPPTFTLQPTAKSAFPTQTATFTAPASGSPAPTLQWQAQAPATIGFTNIPGTTASTYTTPVLAPTHSGTQYRCVATNDAGTATSSNATLTVATGTPAFTLNPVSKSVAAALTTSFTVAATGFPTPTLQWQAQAPATPGFTNIPGATASTYTTPVLALTHSGTQYRCVATNDAGNATSTAATLTVTAPLSPGTAPVVTRFNPATDARNVPLTTLVTVTFSQDIDPTTLTTNSFTLRRADLAANHPANITYDPTNRIATLRPTIALKSDWKYLVGVIGGTTDIKNLSAIPLVTTNSQFYSKDTQPPRFSNVLISSITATSATITWDTNEIADRQVRYGFTTAYGTTTPLVTSRLRKHSVNLTGLTRGRTYNFQLRCADPYGNVGLSSNFTFTTAP